jgi:hypothetical protein
MDWWAAIGPGAGVGVGVGVVDRALAMAAIWVLVRTLREFIELTLVIAA